MSKERVRYFDNFDKDFFQSGQEHKLDPNYKWIRKDLKSRFLSAFIYANAVIFANIYCRFFLHVKIKGAKKIKNIKSTGLFLYGNHTQPIGDVFNPALACFPKRIYTLVSPSNLALPIIGKILPYLGAIPIPDTLSKMRNFNEALYERINEGHPVIIYPEAHLWEYYCDIRPFSDASFKYPVKARVPSFSMTTTYQKRKIGKRPQITIYIDGPFFGDGETTKQQTSDLCKKISDIMKKRSEMSTYQYIRYIKLPVENKE